jgi:hypothetical protein
MNAAGAEQPNVLARKGRRKQKRRTIEKKSAYSMVLKSTAGGFAATSVPDASPVRI